MNEPHSIAYPAREVARVIATRRELMAAYGAACKDGRVRAVQAKGGNFVVVDDPEIRRLLEGSGTKLSRHVWNEDTGRIEP